MGDYSFFIKSAAFLIIINAAIVGFPEGVEALTGGTINTSSVQGTNISFDGIGAGLGEPADDRTVDITSPESFSNVVVNSDGDLVLQNGSSQGFATYSIQSFERNSQDKKEVYVEATGEGDIIQGPSLILEASVDTGNGPEVQNTTVRTPEVYDTVVGNELTFYFSDSGIAKVRSIEDSQQIKHTPDQDIVERTFSDTGLGQFAGTLQKLVALYTTPSAGNVVLGAIFTLYLLGFSVFILKEVVPG